MAEPRREPQTEEEARDLERFLEQGAETSLEVVTTFGATRLPDLAAQPVTVAFDVAGQDLLGRLTTDEDQYLLEIEISGVSPGQAPLLVFINRPNANVQTPVSDAGFVGVLGFFFPHDTVGFRLNATAALRGTADLPLPVTAALVPAALGELGAGAAGRVTKAEIQLVRSVVDLTE